MASSQRLKALMDLIRRVQTSTGSWTRGSELLSALGSKERPLYDDSLENTVLFVEAIDWAGLSKILDAVVTVLALAFLHVKRATERDIWEMMSDEATARLDRWLSLESARRKLKGLQGLPKGYPEGWLGRTLACVIPTTLLGFAIT